MPALFTPLHQIHEHAISVEGSDCNYLLNVLRLNAGDAVTFFDNQGSRYKTVIDSVVGHRAECRIVQKDTRPLAPHPQIVLGQALIKGDKMEWVIQKATELGVHQILPLLTERTVPKPEKDASRKLERWATIAKEAAEQSERWTLPVIHPPCKLSAIDWSAYALVLLCAARGQSPRLSAPAVRDRVTALGASDKLLLLVGPEGGFTPEEETLCLDHGAQAVSLSENILRAETAAVVGVSQLAMVRAN